MKTGRTYEPEFKEQVVAEFAAGARISDVAQKFDVPTGTVAGWCARAGVGRRKRTIDGSPGVLTGGAWLYDRHGVAHWTPGALDPYLTNN